MTLLAVAVVVLVPESQAFPSLIGSRYSTIHQGGGLDGRGGDDYGGWKQRGGRGIGSSIGGIGRGLQMNVMAGQRARGSAATPVEKKRISIVGGGGYLGSVTFGYLQRAGSLFGTGLGGVGFPRNICATSQSVRTLNAVLGKNFVLGFAGEEHARLTDLRNVESIARKLRGTNAIIMGTCSHFQRRPVTGGTYERGPNDKAWEVSFDEPRRSDETINTPDGPEEFESLNYDLFNRVLQACGQVGDVQHLVIVETPTTTNPEKFITLLESSAPCPYTYVRPEGPLSMSKDHTYMTGLRGELIFDSTTVPNMKDEDWKASSSSSSNVPIYREDLAAALVQALQSLDWSTSRCLKIRCKGDMPPPPPPARRLPPPRYDLEWCFNSHLLAQSMGQLS